jgi:membrane-associated PAP2 superfamily phosphatase
MTARTTIGDANPSPSPLDPVRYLLWPSLAFVYAFVVLQISGLDEWVLQWFYDPAAGGFPLRRAFWTQTVLHDGGRTLMRGIATVVVLAVVATWLMPRLRRWRRPATYLLIAIALGVGVVNLGKRLSSVDCPWNLVAFGGTHLGGQWFGNGHSNPKPGHCFPGGHSSGGFALFGLHFFALATGVRRPGRLLLPALVIGPVFAADQWARGAHFPSHDLTTAYLCWMTSALCYQAFFGRRGRRADQVT